MTAIAILGMLTPITYLVMLAIEAAFPARSYPRIRGWRWIGIGFFLLSGVVGSLVPLIISPDWLARHRLLDGTGLGVIGGALVGYVVLSFISFAWHRTMHGVSAIWRLTHQMHHSPVRVDMSGAMLFHPVEMLIGGIYSLATTTLLLGLDPLAASLTFAIASFYGMFQHWNIHTPRWLGYVIQRPESHALHHARDVHAWNYSDLPLWDMVFGSFRNPAHFDGSAGFGAPADRRVFSMLAFVDVNRGILGCGSIGQKSQDLTTIARIEGEPTFGAISA